MRIETETIASMTEANQNFSRVARIADRYGQAVIFRSNKPKYRLVDLEREPEFELTDEEKVDVAAARILRLYRPAFEELAK